MSNKYPTYSGLNLPNVAEVVLDRWKKENIFQKSVDTREGNTPFIFTEGPPSVNGLPGIHQVMARSVKDIWNDMTERIGYWVDMENPCVTYKSKYMESVWWILGQMWNKDLLYKGYTIQPYSPKAGTGLSTIEINQPVCYQDVKDTTCVVQFKIKTDQSLPFENVNIEKAHFLAWTTTPWTLPSNTALTVGPKIDYVLVHSYNQYTNEEIQVVLAKKLVGKQFGKGYTEVETLEEVTTYNQEVKTIPYFIE